MLKASEMAKWLMEGDDIALFGHVSPDGDASGSVMALKMALEQLGKRVFAFLPGGVAGMYRFLPGWASAQCDPEKMPFAPKTALAVDISDKARLGEGLPAFEAAARQGVLDHHPTNAGFGQIHWIDGDASATGELALDVIRAMGAKLTPDMANWLYVAIITDCGQFGYSNTRGNALAAAGACVDAGADPEKISRLLFRTRTRARTQLLGLVLAELSVAAEGKIAYARLTQAMLDKAGATLEDNEGVVNYLSEIEGVRIAILAEERGENLTKLSLRSAPGIDVARLVAVPMGGGGHPCAAGASLKMPLEAALEAALNAANAALFA